jgi:hypothetical protein
MQIFVNDLNERTKHDVPPEEETTAFLLCFFHLIFKICLAVVKSGGTENESFFRQLFKKNHLKCTIIKKLTDIYQQVKNAIKIVIFVIAIYNS